MIPATKLKIVGVFFGVILILNMLLVAFRKTSWGIFWLVLVIVAAISYWGIPWLKRKWIS